jgi:uncharacterized membrane protein YkvA (DUF1232 family)
VSLSAAASFARLARALPSYVMIRRAARNNAAGHPGPYARDAGYVEQGFWAKIRRLAGRVPFVTDLVAAWYCAMDRATPYRVRAVLLGALAYFVVPVDIIPDVVVGLGFVDDATVLATAVASVAEHIKPHHVARARRALAFSTEAPQS